MYILSCCDFKDVHCSIFSKNFLLHKMYYISGSGVDRRGQGGRPLLPMIKKVVVRGTPKSATKSMHWKVALK